MNKDGLKGKTAVVTGGGGVLGRAMAAALARSGARVALIGRTPTPLEEASEELKSLGAESLAVPADVLDERACRRACGYVTKEFGAVDILVNAAGGASPKASTEIEQILLLGKDRGGNPEKDYSESERIRHSDERSLGENPGDSVNAGNACGKEEAVASVAGNDAHLRTILDVSFDAFRGTADLNFLGTFLPTQAFLPELLTSGGCIVNITSMGAQWPLTKSPAYSAGKAAVENYTKWLAVHLARAGVRVNAISPGFFLTKQNRFLLVDEETGEMKPRGRKILDGTPMGRFGEPEELCGALLWLVSEGASFVTGAVIPVDGGFGAYGGV